MTLKLNLSAWNWMSEDTANWLKNKTMKLILPKKKQKSSKTNQNRVWSSLNK